MSRCSDIKPKRVINCGKLEDYERSLERLKESQKIYSTFTQEQVDEIVFRASIAANNARITLAKEAVEETGRGVWEDKILKQHYASEFVFNHYRYRKTCGVIEEDHENGIIKIASPAGVLLGITPVTNPTSTATFKALIALKTRNGIIFCPHPGAKRSTVHAAQIIHDAAVKAGAPPGIIAWIQEPTVEISKKLMAHPTVNLILATGGPAMVHSAYSSGKPAIGVGPGNVPAIIDELADMPNAVSSIIHSKTFDHGMVCASEQTVILVKSVYKNFVDLMRQHGGYVLPPEKKKKVGEVIIKEKRLNPDIVGKSAMTIAEMAGIQVPEFTRLLIGEIREIGENEPFSYEKLSPTIGLMEANDFDEAVEIAHDLLEFCGKGHSVSVFTAESEETRIAKVAERVVASRVLVNMPSSQGAIGDVYNFRLDPSLTLGCGTYANNITSSNVGVEQLLNIKTVVMRRENMLWIKLPVSTYFKRGCLAEALKDIRDRKRVFVITDEILYNLGYVKKLTDILDRYKINYKVFSAVKPDPDLSTIEEALKDINTFEPDAIIALGGGSPMDAGKMLWLLYEHPESSFDELALRFMDIRKRICRFPPMGHRAIYIAIPTTSGTGSEDTPFAVITDDKTGIKYPIADYAIMPTMAIVDADFVIQMPKSLVAAGGYDAISHAVESLVAVTATDFTQPLSLEALEILFEYLPRSYANGANDQIAREKVHYAATIAGMAFANAFLGVNHSIAHKIGAEFHIPHGIANAILLPHVVRFNSDELVRKMGTFSQYRVPESIKRYAKAANVLQLGGRNEKERVANFVKALVKMRSDLNIPPTIRAFGVAEQDFLAKIDYLAEMAFDDQCTSTNPRYPLISEIRELLNAAYYQED